MTMSDIAALRQKYKEAGQDHVFTFWDSLTETEKQSLVAQLESIDPLHVTEIANKVLAGSPTTAATPTTRKDADSLKPVPSSSSGSTLPGSGDSKTRQEWYDLGLKLIADNKVGVFLLAGGQGTRLGSTDPKGCFDVNLLSHKSLFQLQAERIMKICQLAEAKYGGGGGGDQNKKVVIPWYIMTSGPTRKETENFFIQHNYFGMDSSNVFFFEQGILPCLTNEGKMILKNAHTVAVAPDGNGGVYAALHKHGILADLKYRGIEHIHTYCVDNCLVRIADPIFIGFAASRNVDIATKVVRKRDAGENVGLIVSKSGRPTVIEYSEISPDLACEEEPSTGLLRFRAANIVNHYYSSKFLLDIPRWSGLKMPFHIANKKIPYIDLESGELIEKPVAPNGIKLEQFVFDVFPYLSFDQFGLLEVDRALEFSPLKNGPGSKNDNSETSRRDLLAVYKKWLTEAGAQIADGVEVEVSPLTSYGGEGLDAYKGKVFDTSCII